MILEFELLQPPYGGTSEGPVWDGSGILYTQIQACRIIRFDTLAESFTVYRTDTNYANGLFIDSERRLFACEGGGRAGLAHQAGAGHDYRRIQLPCCVVPDAAGPFSYDRANQELDHESVYRLDPQTDGSWSIQRATFDTTRPNGLLFSSDQTTLYLAQSGRRSDEKRQLRAYSVDGIRDQDSYEVLHDFGDHRGVDGMCLDVDGNILATAGWEKGGPGPSIYLFSPSGEVLQRHPVPAQRPTNCAFGGDDLSTLYVTSTEGHLFRARTDLRGPALI